MGGGECGRGEGRGAGQEAGGRGVQPPISPFQPTTLTHSLPPLPIVPFTPTDQHKGGVEKEGRGTPVPY